VSGLVVSLTPGADDGIRTRDPHLGKVGQAAGPEASLALTCPFRYGSTRFSTIRYASFFPYLPTGLPASAHS
jgi:hypothetical protein